MGGFLKVRAGETEKLKIRNQPSAIEDWRLRAQDRNEEIHDF
jgi:hypothetical protein